MAGPVLPVGLPVAVPDGPNPAGTPLLSTRVSIGRLLPHRRVPTVVGLPLMARKFTLPVRLYMAPFPHLLFRMARWKHPELLLTAILVWALSSRLETELTLLPLPSRPVRYRPEVPPEAFLLAPFRGLQ